MDDKLRLNTKFWGKYEGIIPRRDYFLNCIYIWAITTGLTLPYYIWLMFQSEDLMYSPSEAFFSAPPFLQAMMIASVIITGIYSSSNIHRRLNDIFGEVKSGINILFTTLIILMTCSFMMPLYLVFIIYPVGLALCCYLIFKRGKISKNYPYDYKNEFNWGAFLGTWIWGIVNKSYAPFWIFLLWFTPFNFYFHLYCGMKGNEWAYKNKGWTDVKKFNQSQEKQATIFAVLLGIILPILYMCLIFGIILLLMNIPSDDKISSNNTPATQTESFDNKMDNLFNNLANSYFESYEITDRENKFYVKESDWKWLSFSDKKGYLDLAATKAAAYKSKVAKENGQKYTYYSKTSELPNTKIYGAQTHQLLGEFVMEDMKEDANFVDFVKSAAKAYRFYKVEK